MSYRDIAQYVVMDGPVANVLPQDIWQDPVQDIVIVHLLERSILWPRQLSFSPQAPAHE